MGYPPFHRVLWTRRKGIQPRPVDWAPGKGYREVLHAGMFARRAAYRN